MIEEELSMTPHQRMFPDLPVETLLYSDKFGSTAPTILGFTKFSEENALSSKFCSCDDPWACIPGYHSPKHVRNSNLVPFTQELMDELFSSGTPLKKLTPVDSFLCCFNYSVQLSSSDRMTNVFCEYIGYWTKEEGEGDGGGDFFLAFLSLHDPRYNFFSTDFFARKKTFLPLYVPIRRFFLPKSSLIPVGDDISSSHFLLHQIFLDSSRLTFLVYSPTFVQAHFFPKASTTNLDPATRHYLVFKILRYQVCGSNLCPDVLRRIYFCYTSFFKYRSFRTFSVFQQVCGSLIFDLF